MFNEICLTKNELKAERTENEQEEASGVRGGGVFDVRVCEVGQGEGNARRSGMGFADPGVRGEEIQV